MSKIYSKSKLSLSKTLNSLSDQDLYRKRPQTTKMDLEHMFQQSLALYATYKTLVEENESIKQELSKIENIKQQKQQLIFSVQNVISEKSKDLRPEDKNSSWWVFKLKKQIHVLKKQIEQRSKTIADFNKNREHQILHEMQVQKQCYEDMLKSSPTKTPNKKNIQKYDEIYEMKMYESSQRQKINELENELEAQERECSKVIAQIHKRKQQIDKIKEEQEEVKIIQETTLSQIRNHHDKPENNKNIRNSETMRELEGTKTEKLEQIKYLQDTIDRIIQRENLEASKLDEQYQKMLKNYELLTQQTLTHAIKRKATIKTSAIQKNQTVIQIPKLLLPKVKTQDILQICKYVNYTLFIKRLTHKDWQNMLFRNSPQVLSIKQLSEQLQKHPFQIRNSADAMLLARYLVEDNNQPKVFYDQNLTQTTPIIKSILEKSIGPLIHYTQHEEAELAKYTGDMVRRYQALIMPTLEQKNITSKTLKHKEFSEMIEGCMLDLTKEHIDYMIIYMFSFCRELGRLPFKKILDIGIVPLQYDR